MQAWISQQSWDAKPIRALSGTAWLCGAESKFDDIFVQWNDAPVLIKWLTAKKTKDPVILAGTTHVENSIKKPVHQDVEGSLSGLSEDPWKRWIENKGGSGMNANGNQSKGSAMQVQLQQPRRLEAPIEDRFNQQQSALQEMREKSDKAL